MTDDQDPFSAEALRDWLEALQSKAETPEVIALQRDLLQLLQRTARQLPEVQALVDAAREARAMLNAPCITCGCGTGSMGDDMLGEALEPFRVASKNG